MLECPLPLRLLGSGAYWGEVTSSPHRPPPSPSSPQPHVAFFGLRAVGGERNSEWNPAEKPLHPL